MDYALLIFYTLYKYFQKELSAENLHCGMMCLFHLLIVFYQLTNMERFALFTAPVDIKSAVLHLLVAGLVDHGVKMPTPSFVMVCNLIF